MKTFEGWMMTYQGYLCGKLYPTAEECWENTAIKMTDIPSLKRQGNKAIKVRIEQIGSEEEAK